MSYFYGTVQGNRGLGTRIGTRKSRMVTECASWNGAIRCEAYVDAKTGRDFVRVEKIRWKGAGEEKLLYDGPIGERKRR